MDDDYQSDQSNGFPRPRDRYTEARWSPEGRLNLRKKQAWNDHYNPLPKAWRSLQTPTFCANGPDRNAVRFQPGVNASYWSSYWSRILNDSL